MPSVIRGATAERLALQSPRNMAKMTAACESAEILVGEPIVLIITNKKCRYGCNTDDRAILPRLRMILGFFLSSGGETE